jgi:hypothetical protein
LITALVPLLEPNTSPPAALWGIPMTSTAGSDSMCWGVEFVIFAVALNV